MPISQDAPNAENYWVEEDVDARPAQATATSTSVQSGWDAAESLTVTSDFPTEVKFEDAQHQVFKFLDEAGPFAIYKQHFLSQKTKGKRSYVCIGAKCPLCIKLQERAENKRAFTVVTLNSKEGMQRQMLISGARLYQALHAAHYSPQGPLTKGYWAIVRLGKGPQTNYTVTPIKERDLEEDWNISQEKASAVVASSEVYTRGIIKEHSFEELDEIADSLI
jgi:hypothetical protein